MGSKLQENHFTQEKLPNNKNNIKTNYLERWKLESVQVEAQFTGDILIWIDSSLDPGIGFNSLWSWKKFYAEVCFAISQIFSFPGNEISVFISTSQGH